MALASVNVSVAVLTWQSLARSTSAETCYLDWANGTCWLPEAAQAIVAVALTAVTDFNSRKATALPVLGSLEGCDKQLQFQLLDSGGAAAKSLQSLGDLSGTDVVIGPLWDSASTTTAVVTGRLDIPQISYGSSSADLSDTFLYPRFMRIIPSDLAPASGLCSFWKHELGLSTVAVIYERTAYGRAYEEAAKAACQSLKLTFFSKDIPDFYDDAYSEESIRSAVASLSATGAKAVLVVTSIYVRFIVASALDTGLLRPGTSWVFSDSVSTDDFDTELNETEKAAVNGSLQISAWVGATNNPQWTHFANERWATLQPGDFNPFLPADWQIRDNFFSTVNPSEVGTLAYDAIIAAGGLFVTPRLLVSHFRFQPSCVTDEASATITRSVKVPAVVLVMGRKGYTSVRALIIAI